MNSNDETKETTDDSVFTDILELARAEKLRSDILENFITVVGKFVKFPDEDFKKVLIMAAENLMVADASVKSKVLSIAKKRKLASESEVKDAKMADRPDNKD